MTDRRVPELNAVKSPPQVALEYEQLKQNRTYIGRGGQGVVYRVNLSSSTNPEQVAIKEPVAGSQTIPIEDMEAMIDEAQTWETLDRREREKPRWDDSEHIVGIIDVGDDEFPWIAMEYMDGGGLEDRLEAHSNGMPVDEALWIGECICRGLEVAHNYGIAHLDLKPSNVLFRETAEEVWDVAKIGDWGLARELTQKTGSMEQLSIQYAAPEQFDRDRFGEPDMLTDVYQAGALVYAMLTGSPPYAGEQANIMHNIVYGDKPRSLLEIRDDLPDTIDQMVLKALEKEKNDRYRNIGEFEKALHATRTEQPLPRVVSQRVESTDNSNTISENQTDKDNKSTNSKPAAEIVDSAEASGTINANQTNAQSSSIGSVDASNLSQRIINHTLELKNSFFIENKKLFSIITTSSIIFAVLFFSLTHIINPDDNLLAFLTIILPPMAGGGAAGWYKLSSSLPVVVSIATILVIFIGAIIRGTLTATSSDIIIVFIISIVSSLISFNTMRKFVDIISE